jgi:ribonuclease HI
MEQKVYWHHPDAEKGEVALDVDGSSYRNPPRRAGYGGVIRDHRGEWKMGFSGHVDYTDCLRAELLAILNGLLVAWELKDRPRNVICRSDCLQAVEYMKDSTLNPCEDSDIVDSIRELVSRDWWSVSFEHILRECNQCADYMAKMGANSFDCPLKTFEEPPIVLHSQLKSRVEGTIYIRR